MAENSTSPRTLFFDRSQALTQLFGTIEDLERSLVEVLPKKAYPHRKYSQPTRPTQEQESPNSKKRQKPKNLEESAREREKVRSVSPLLSMLTEDTLLVESRVTPEPERLTPNRFLPVCSDHLGPGAYNLPRPRVSKETFSVLPRFPFLDTIIAHTRVATQVPRKEDNIKRNIESIDLYRPVNFRQKLKEKAVKEDFRANVCRLARKEIEESAKQKHIDDLKTKFRRHEWRLRAEEISEGKRLWVGLFYYLSSMHFWRQKQEKRKVSDTQLLHARSQNVLKFLLLMAICVGKISHKVRQKRYRRAMAVIRRILPYSLKWMRRRRARMRDSIVEMIETSLSMDTIYKIIATWKRRIVMIQRTAKAWLQRRRAYKVLLLRCWSKVEASLPAKQRPAESPPDAVKAIFLDSFIKVRMKAHVFDIENWAAKCESMTEDYQKLVYEMLDDPPPPPKMPRRPQFPTFLTSEEVQSLLIQAEKKKYNWARMIRENRKLPTRKESLIDPES